MMMKARVAVIGKSAQPIKPLISGVFNDDALDDVRDVLATIDRRFKFLVNLFPLNHRQRVGRIVKELGDRGVINIVAFVFETMNLDRSEERRVGKEGRSRWLSDS